MAPVNPSRKPKSRLSFQKQLTDADFRSLLTKEGEPPKLNKTQIFEWLDMLESIELAEDRNMLFNAVKRMVKTRSNKKAAPADATGAKESENAFIKWYAGIADAQQLDPNPDDPRHFYDYRKAWLAGANVDGSGHWPSKFKLAGHPQLIVDGIDTRTGQPASWKTMRESQNARQQVEFGNHIQNFLSNILGGK